MCRIRTIMSTSFFHKVFKINDLRGPMKNGIFFTVFTLNLSQNGPKKRPFRPPTLPKTAKNGPFIPSSFFRQLCNLRPFAGFLSRPATAWAWALPTINFRSLAGLRGFPGYPGGGRALRPVLGRPGAKFGQFSERRALNLRINGSRAGAFANPSGGSGRPNFIL